MPSVFVDSSRHTFLEFRDTGKVKHFISMLDGSIDIIQMHPKEYKLLKPIDGTPEHFAEVYLNSYMEISRSARAILRSILGDHAAPVESAGGPRFSGGTVSLAQIVEDNQWNPSRVRKLLRKLMDKPGGRWEWSPEDAERVTQMIREGLASDE